MYVSVLSCFSHVWLFSTSWTIALQALLFMGFFRQEYWSGLPCPPSGHLPSSGIEPESPEAPALEVDSLPLSHWGSPTYTCMYVCIKYHPCSNRQWLFCRTSNRAWVSSLLFRNSLLSFTYHWVKGLLNNWRSQEGSGGERDVRCLRLWLSKRNIDAKKMWGGGYE